MASVPSFDDLLAVVAAAASGNQSARVNIPDACDAPDHAARLGLALNHLLDEFALRAAPAPSEGRVAAVVDHLRHGPASESLSPLESADGPLVSSSIRNRANARTRLLPIVILTASKEAEDVARGYALGANAYVRKPVKFTDFADAAKTLGLFWLLFNEQAPAPREVS
jgi:CheY-like chemotaxis protein